MWGMEAYYEKYGLQYNPFPAGPAEDLRLEELQVAGVGKFDIIISTFRQYSNLDNKKFRFIVSGPWGAGKSLALRFYAKLLRDNYGERVLDLQILPTPPNIKDIVSLLLMRINYLISRGKIQSIRQVFREYQKEIESAARKGDMSIIYRKFSEIFYKIIEEDNKIVYISFDQLESAINQMDQQTLGIFAEFLRNFSYLSEDIQRGFAVGIAAVDFAHERLSRWEAIKGIPTYWLTLLNDIDEVRELLKVYLKVARLPEDQMPDHVRDAIKENPVYPFTESALDELLKSGEGRPRYICRYARFALENAVKQDLPEVDAQQVLFVVKPEMRYWLTALNQEPRRDKKSLIQVLDRVFDEGKRFLRGFNYAIVARRIKKEIAEKLGIKIAAKTEEKYIKIPSDFLLIKDQNIIALVVHPGTISRKTIENLLELTNIKIEDKPISKIVILSMMGPTIGARQMLSLLGLKTDVRLRILKEDPEDLGRILALYLRLEGELPGYIRNEDDLVREINHVINIITET